MAQRGHCLHHRHRVAQRDVEFLVPILIKYRCETYTATRHCDGDIRSWLLFNNLVMCLFVRPYMTDRATLDPQFPDGSRTYVNCPPRCHCKMHVGAATESCRNVGSFVNVVSFVRSKFNNRSTSVCVCVCVRLSSHKRDSAVTV